MAVIVQPKNGLTPIEYEVILARIESERKALGISQEVAQERAIKILGKPIKARTAHWSGAVGQTRPLSLEVMRAMAQAVGLEIVLDIRRPFTKGK